MKHLLLRLLMAAALHAAVDPAAAHAAPLPEPAPPPVHADQKDRHTLRVSPPELVSPGVYRLGDITIDKLRKSLSFPATLNMERGLLEYLLVAGGGKAHESLLITTVEPYNLQLASLLLGMEGARAPLPFQGAQQMPQGDPVEISLKLEEPDPGGQVVKPEAWISVMSGGQKQDAPALRWVFCGSLVQNGRFAAQVERSIVAIFHDPVAMFDTVTAGGENDQLWYVKEGVVPAPGTPVSVTIKLLK